MILDDAKVTSKGQITVPKSVREELGIRVGDRIEFVKEDGRLRIQKQINESPFLKWSGYFKDLAGQDVDELIDEWRGR